MLTDLDAEHFTFHKANFSNITDDSLLAWRHTMARVLHMAE
jgi:hypothetical protein